ncbi:hypothetical protein HanPSC8_Chr01g0027421 [Helianthus annuus]|nr:hypothetical protein HanPSC8_Chr01g0027421 [Helianthus annuus]
MEAMWVVTCRLVVEFWDDLIGDLKKMSNSKPLSPRAFFNHAPADMVLHASPTLCILNPSHDR